jgi:hypothetical protein
MQRRAHFQLALPALALGLLALALGPLLWVPGVLVLAKRALLAKQVPCSPNQSCLLYKACIQTM